MLYAKVVLGIPVEGPFDYIVPSALEEKIKEGSRAWVNFRNKKMLGYVVGLSHKTKIKELKKILEIIDDCPVLDKNMLSLAREVSRYYCCSWGEAIETALPLALRKGKRAPCIANPAIENPASPQEAVLLHDLDGQERWNVYLEQIKEAVGNKKSVIILLPDIVSIFSAKEALKSSLGLSAGILFRKKPNELEEWLQVKTGKINIVIGTRSSIFAPVSNLGLVIIDEEQDPVYKQDQMPHYNAREVAFMRIGIEKAKLILGSTSPSIESFYLAKKSKIKYLLLPRKRDYPEIKIIDMKFEYRAYKQKNIILSKYMADSVFSCLDSGQKALLFLNRKGFATYASCRNCNEALKCPRCNINLVYYFQGDLLNCHYCNFKMQPPKICPRCNASYIRYSGTGTQKLESELSRLFSRARIKRIESGENIEIKDADIFVATSSIIKQKKYNFDLVGALAIDYSLNRIDLRSTEKTFALLAGLLGITEKKLLIQTRLPNHYCFKSLVKNDTDIFYNEELRQRRQLGFPPYRHMFLVKLRGKKEEKVKEAGSGLFERLNKCNKNKEIRIISVNPGYPSKLRGNFYWQIVITSGNVQRAVEFLKIRLKEFSRSGIIVTVDVDPL